MSAPPEPSPDGEGAPDGRSVNPAERKGIYEAWGPHPCPSPEKGGERLTGEATNFIPLPSPRGGARVGW